MHRLFSRHICVAVALVTLALLGLCSFSSPAKAEAASKSPGGSANPIDINKANAEQLTSIPGIGKVMAHLEKKGWLEDTHIFFTPDHGAWDGEYGLLLIGPSLADDLTRLPLVWKPAVNDNVPAAMVQSPVGLLDLAPTWLNVAGLETPEWMDGHALPRSQAEADDQSAVIVDQQREPWLTDGPGLRTDHDFERAVIQLHPLEDPGGKLPGLPEFVAGVGDLSAPPLAIDLPRIELGDAAGDRPGQRGLAWDGDRLSRRQPRVEPL